MTRWEEFSRYMIEDYEGYVSGHIYLHGVCVKITFVRRQMLAGHAKR